MSAPCCLFDQVSGFAQHGVAVFAVVLMSFISMEAPAQDENDTCPCFSYEEVESIFLR